MTSGPASSELASGLHRFTSRRSSAALAASLQNAGTRTFVLDLKGVRDKPGLLRAWREAIDAPRWTGSNWDAIEEGMRDLSWARARRYAVIVTGARGLARADPAAWATALDLLRHTAAEWDSRGVPMIVLVRGGLL